jgi:hypothetical protein
MDTTPAPGPFIGKECRNRETPCIRRGIDLFKPEKESMSLRTLCLTLLVVACLLILVLPVQAESDGRSSVNVIYQTTFSSDPHWTTNSPSSDYWDPSTGRYHFSLEPSTGNYAYTTIDNLDGPFTFEYDVILDRVDDDATFRFGLTGAEMDFNKGPNVFSMFSNGKHDRIMWLHLVTTGSKQMEVNSQSDDELTSGSIAYKGPTVRYELNKTYNVIINYDEESRTLTMRVNDKATAREVWAYFLKTVESVRGMNRIYLGSRGDYGPMYVYASGYIDNVRLTQPGPAITPEETLVTPGITTPRVTTKKPTVLPTPLPTDTPESPAGGILAVLALGVIGTFVALRSRKKY